MKSNIFNYSLLAVGVAAVMGASTANAAETSVDPTAGTNITNFATAVYKVGDDAEFQPEVQSNEVVVNVSETANFSLVASMTEGTVDLNTNQAATPGANNTFTHILTNEGNVTDTYTINTIGNNDPNLGTVAQDYPLDSTTVSYTITQPGNVVLTTEQKAALLALGQDESGTVSDDGTIQLLPGLVANLSYDALTPAAQLAGTTGVGTLTASSEFITGNPVLVNENETIVRLPVFKIIKTAACNGNTDCVNFDLNATNTDFSYSINVTNVSNDYSTDADNFVIRDVLPVGMTVNGTVTSSVGTVSAVTTNAAGRQVIDVTVPSLAVGDDLTISFDVNVDKTEILAAGNSVTNDATVYDNFDDTTPDITNKNAITSDITDSTDDTIDDTRLPPTADQAGGDGEDSTPTITLTDREITISDGTTEEVPVTGSVQYTHTISNNGNATEGGATRPINITITDPNGDTPLDVINPVYVDSNDDEQPLEVVTAGTGEYKLPDTVTIAPDATVEIRYTVNSVGDNTNIGDSDTNIVTITPGGDDVPAEVTAQNTTTIQGLTLLKQVALQKLCTGGIGTYEGAGTGTAGDITNATFTAEPSDCIYYQITATNTFTTKDLTAVTLSDEKAQWNSKSTYQGEATGLIGTSTTGVTDSDTGDFITTTFTTLPAEQSGTLTFSIKVNP